jgi:hypothetical protein
MRHSSFTMQGLFSLKGFRMHRATYLAAALVSIICVAGGAVPALRHQIVLVITRRC